MKHFGQHGIWIQILSRWCCYLLTSDWDPFISRKRILTHISWRLDSILFFIKHFLFVLKISKTFVFFLRTSSEYSTRYGQESVLKICFQGYVVTDPCPYLFEYSPDVLKKKIRVLDLFNFNTDKKYFIKNSICRIKFSEDMDKDPFPYENWKKRVVIFFSIALLILNFPY